MPESSSENEASNITLSPLAQSLLRAPSWESLPATTKVTVQQLLHNASAAILNGKSLTPGQLQSLRVLAVLGKNVQITGRPAAVELAMLLLVVHDRNFMQTAIRNIDLANALQTQGLIDTEQADHLAINNDTVNYWFTAALGSLSDINRFARDTGLEPEQVQTLRDRLGERYVIDPDGEHLSALRSYCELCEYTEQTQAVFAEQHPDLATRDINWLFIDRLLQTTKLLNTLPTYRIGPLLGLKTLNKGVLNVYSSNLYNAMSLATRDPEFAGHLANYLQEYDYQLSDNVAWPWHTLYLQILRDANLSTRNITASKLQQSLTTASLSKTYSASAAFYLDIDFKRLFRHTETAKTAITQYIPPVAWDWLLESTATAKVRKGEINISSSYALAEEWLTGISHTPELSRLLSMWQTNNILMPGNLELTEPGKSLKNEISDLIPKPFSKKEYDSFDLLYSKSNRGGFFSNHLLPLQLLGNTDIWPASRGDVILKVVVKSSDEPHIPAIALGCKSSFPVDENPVFWMHYSPEQNELTLTHISASGSWYTVPDFQSAGSGSAAQSIQQTTIPGQVTVVDWYSQNDVRPRPNHEYRIRPSDGAIINATGKAVAPEQLETVVFQPLQQRIEDHSSEAGPIVSAVKAEPGIHQLRVTLAPNANVAQALAEILPAGQDILYSQLLFSGPTATAVQKRVNQALAQKETLDFGMRYPTVKSLRLLADIHFPGRQALSALRSHFLQQLRGLPGVHEPSLSYTNTVYYAPGLVPDLPASLVFSEQELQDLKRSAAAWAERLPRSNKSTISELKAAILADFQVLINHGIIAKDMQTWLDSYMPRSPRLTLQYYLTFRGRVQFSGYNSAKLLSLKELVDALQGLYRAYGLQVEDLASVDILERLGMNEAPTSVVVKTQETNATDVSVTVPSPDLFRELEADINDILKRAVAADLAELMIQTGATARELQTSLDRSEHSVRLDDRLTTHPLQLVAALQYLYQEYGLNVEQLNSVKVLEEFDRAVRAVPDRVTAEREGSEIIDIPRGTESGFFIPWIPGPIFRGSATDILTNHPITPFIRRPFVGGAENPSEKLPAGVPVPDGTPVVALESRSTSSKGNLDTPEGETSNRDVGGTWQSRVYPELPGWEQTLELFPKPGLLVPGFDLDSAPELSHTSGGVTRVDIDPKDLIFGPPVDGDPLRELEAEQKQAEQEDQTADWGTSLQERYFGSEKPGFQVGRPEDNPGSIGEQKQQPAAEPVSALASAGGQVSALLSRLASLPESEQTGYLRTVAEELHRAGSNQPQSLAAQGLKQILGTEAGLSAFLHTAPPPTRQALLRALASNGHSMLLEWNKTANIAFKVSGWGHQPIQAVAADFYQAVTNIEQERLRAELAQRLNHSNHTPSGTPASITPQPSLPTPALLPSDKPTIAATPTPTHPGASDSQPLPSSPVPAVPGEANTGYLSTLPLAELHEVPQWWRDAADSLPGPLRKTAHWLGRRGVATLRETNAKTEEDLAVLRGEVQDPETREQLRQIREVAPDVATFMMTIFKILNSSPLGALRTVAWEALPQLIRVVHQRFFPPAPQDVPIMSPLSLHTVPGPIEPVLLPSSEPLLADMQLAADQAVLAPTVELPSLVEGSDVRLVQSPSADMRVVLMTDTIF